MLVTLTWLWNKNSKKPLKLKLRLVCRSFRSFRVKGLDRFSLQTSWISKIIYIMTHDFTPEPTPLNHFHYSLFLSQKPNQTQNVINWNGFLPKNKTPSNFPTFWSLLGTIFFYLITSTSVSRNQNDKSFFCETLKVIM